MTQTRPAPSLHSPRERWALMACAQAVPHGGLILEVGTGTGGTAQLFRTQADASVAVASVDVDQRYLPARADLEQTGIAFYDGTSSSVAANWSTRIDLLFVDGGHRLCDVHTDVMAWLPHLNPGATVAFHDYDEPLAGGLYYLGVKLAVDTCLRLGVLRDPEQHLTLLMTRGGVPLRGTITADDHRETLRLHSELIISVRKHLTPALLDWLLTGDDAPACRELVDAGPQVEAGLDGQQHPIATRFNQLLMAYCFDAWMKAHAVAAVESGTPLQSFHTHAQQLTDTPALSLYLEMLRWVDADRRRPYPTVYDLETLARPTGYPDSLDPYALATVDEISRFVTLEQVRLNMMSAVTNPIFDKVVRGYDAEA